MTAGHDQDGDARLLRRVRRPLSADELAGGLQIGLRTAIERRLAQIEIELQVD